MIKLCLTLLFSFVFLLSCKSSTKSYLPSLKIDSLRYSAYRLRTNELTLEWELYLDYYIQINKDGRFLVMRHDTTSALALFFQGSIDSTVHRLVDSLTIVSLDTAYFSPEPQIYDGNTFLLNYAGETNHEINYHQIDAPSFLQRLSNALDSLVLTAKQPSQAFDLSHYEIELKKALYERWDSLPKLESLPKVEIDHEKFKPPTKKR